MSRVLLFSVVFLLITQSIPTDIPKTMSYQGVLTKASGVLADDGNYNLTFRLYSTETGGSALWTETHPSVAVVKGIFNAILGSIAPLNLPFDQQYWLSIQVGVGAELLPRLKLTSTPYSLSGWSLTGNAGTTPGTNFLGTTDNKALELKVNNARIIRLEPNPKSPNILGGFSGNTITSGVHGATISGGGTDGFFNRVTDDYGTIGGGRDNQAGDNAETTSNSAFATVGGGWNNQATGYSSTVGGGYFNRASGDSSTVGGGFSNQATGFRSTVSGGRDNQATGSHSTVPGGSRNIASGDYSFAAGRRAKANHYGSFVWGDSTDADVASTVSNQFKIRASGGVYLYTNGSLTTGMYLSSGGSGWNVVSDRAMKANIREIDGKDILNRLRGIPICQWSYKTQDPSIEHIGPMAQDWKEAFGLGEDDKSINSIDADGVALAAIQGLYEIIKEKDAKIAELEARLTALERLVTK